jgi:cytochrome c oxidase subunit I
MSDVALLPEVTEPLPALSKPEGLFSWVATVDHKQIGILYLVSSLFFLVVGGLEAFALRLQLAQPRNNLLSTDAYNQLFTMHGTTMVFLVVMPFLIGLGNYFVPLMIGARDIAFPRLNALSLWTLVFGGLLLYFSFIAGGAPNVGWYSYAPLSERPYTSLPGTDYWALGLFIMGIGSVGAAINLIVTVAAFRAPGMSFRLLPLFVWMSFINAFLILFAIPVLNAAVIMLLIDRQLGAHFFTPSSGGSALLWQHAFWTFGHPEVYIMVLPAFGIISEVISVFSRKVIFGYAFLAGSTVAIAFLSFATWAHHMFADGLGPAWELTFSATSLLIAIPTGVKIFNWIATMWGGSIRFTTSMLYATSFLVQFTIGGITGVTFAMVPIDWQTTNSYYVVAHIHYVLNGGSLWAILAGIYYWFPKITGRMLNERLGKINFWLNFIGFNMTFLVQHILGLMGMPRRVATYPDLPGWGDLNLISTIGVFFTGLATLVFIWNVLSTLRNGERAPSNPWGGWTLEWATSSPPPHDNFKQVPPIHSRRPLWDLARDQGSTRET